MAAEAWIDVTTDIGAVVERARQGDLSAFHTLVQQYGDKLYRLALRITRSPEDAEDAVQETLLKAFQKLDSFDARAHFGTWIYRVGANTCLDLVRKRKRTTARIDSIDDEAVPPPVAAKPDAERHLFGDEVRRRLDAVLDGLTPTERTAFVLRHYEGCSTAEIGSALGVKDNAAKQAVFRAVRKVRSALEPIVRPTP